MNARLRAVEARVAAAGPTNIGFPAARDIDYRPLAPLLGHLLNNLGDPRIDPLYPGHVHDLEREVLDFTAELFRAPSGWSGYLNSGGTEGNLYGMWLGRTKLPNAVAYYSSAAHPVDRTTWQNHRAAGSNGHRQSVSTMRRPLRSCVVMMVRDRDLASLVLPRWGRVVRVDGPLPFVVVDADGSAVEPIEVFLRDFVARGSSQGSVRSYAYALVRWWRFLRVVEVGWERATSAEGRDFVLWMRQARKGAGARKDRSTFEPGSVNPVTRKQRLDDSFKVTTVRHSNAVLHTFYEFWIEQGTGPLVNPMPRDAARGQRPHGHHNPMEPFRAEGRLRYNPKLPRRRVRAMPDEAWEALFAALRSERDRAITALAVSTGARAGELLGIRLADVDWGDQLIRVQRKGTGAEQWLPGSPEAFLWLRLYLEQVGPLRPGDVLWVTLRRRGPGRVRRPLSYDALRAVLRRVNHLSGANWTMHDLRHTCALRMARDPRLSLVDIQRILGHAHLSTTQIYLQADDHEVIDKVSQYLATPPPSAAGAVAHGYAAHDVAVLLGGTSR
ncbi:tyrosine-type recombinase/integrase [Paractinoplanes ferrugineus]